MNEIHSTCIIDKNVVLGMGNKILPYTIIYGPCKIGNNNTIGPNVIIGTPGEDSKNPNYDSSSFGVEIGDDNIIREFTVITKPITNATTKIGNDVFLMRGVHIPHDVILQDKVVISPMSVMAGFTTILQGANIGLGVSIHQFSVIGQFSMVAMGSSIRKNVKPFSICLPGLPSMVNIYALKKYNLMEYEKEISDYLLLGTPPKSDKIGAYIEEFNSLSTKSTRKKYK